MSYYEMLLAMKLKKDPPLPPIPDNAYLLEQATGDVITLTDAVALPMPKATSNLQPTQDLHGYSYPWVGGAGKNLLPMTVAGIKTANTSGTWSGNTYTLNNVTFELLTDSASNITGIKVNGTANDTTVFYVSGNFNLTSQCYINTNAQNIVGSLRATDGTQTYIAQTEDVLIPSGNYTQAYIVLLSGTVATNIIYYPMIRLSTVTDPTFAPYSNICPISGYDSAKYTRTGVNVWDEQTELGNIDNTTGENTTSNEYIRSKDYTLIQPSTQYCLTRKAESDINPRLFWYDENKTYISNVFLTAQYQVVTSPSNAKYFKVKAYGTTYNNDISINYPSTITAYQPYQGQAITLTFDNTVYSGVLDWCTGVVTVDKGVGIIPTITEYRTINNHNYTFWNEPNIKYIAGNADTIIADCLKSQLAVTGDFNIYQSYNGIVTGVGDNYTMAEYNSNIAGTKYIYPLATPQTIQLTPTQLKTLAGYNTIYTDVGNITLEYWTKEVRE